MRPESSTACSCCDNNSQLTVLIDANFSTGLTACTGRAAGDITAGTGRTADDVTAGEVTAGLGSAAGEVSILREATDGGGAAGGATSTLGGDLETD